MKKLVLTLAAMTTLAAAAAPASAQSFFTTYPNSGRFSSGYTYQYPGAMAYASCQIVKVRKHLPDGRTVIRRERSCY